ncbi:Trm112 family protein [Streptomyces sp. MZ04]|uniref:Trm112 family protein n=1 Tax=Streptomyces sp. MZ04 TaxID=2559236 RepID=UPI00107E7685|nr:Trm112 family protein [Streptomyces sp. MZ04]TGA85627.1 Trm112 family protein [Streptomyces sp. MZ04]
MYKRQDKGPLHLLEPEEPLVPEEVLYNPRLRRRYPIIDGIPQLLPSSGEQISEDEHEQLLKRISP